jgi:type III restriction enzyme
LKLYQFDSNAKEIHYSGFQPDFILYLDNSDFYIQIFIEPKGTNLLEKDQWKENIFSFINQNESEIVIDEDVEGIKIKGVKFYTRNDGRNAMDQIGEIALGKPFESLSFE